MRVHSSKSYSLTLDRLVNIGLAVVEPNGQPGNTWYEVDERAARMYMAYLAATVAEIATSMGQPGDSVVPLTDSAASNSALGPVGDLRTQQAGLRYRLINEALPVPDGTIDAVHLRQFKEENHASLKRIRTYLDRRLLELAELTDEEYQALRFENLVEEVEEDIQRVREEMSKRLWPKVILKGVGGILGTALAGSAGVVGASTSMLTLGLAAGAGLLSAGSAGYDTFEILQEGRSSRVDSPLAYAVLAASEFGPHSVTPRGQR